MRTIINKLYRVSQYISCGMVCFNTLISRDLDYYYLYSFSTLCLILKVNILKKYILMLFPRILRLCVCGGPCAVFSYYKLSDSPGYTIMRTKHYRAGCRAQSWRGREDGLLIFFFKVMNDVMKKYRFHSISFAGDLSSTRRDHHTSFSVRVLTVAII